MPYVNESRRHLLDLGQAPETAGELNYVITAACRDYLRRQGSALNYQKLNDVLGALEGAKLELYRRIAAPYEERKREENGDVYFKP